MEVAYYFLFRRWPPGLIGGTVDFIFPTAIYDDVDVCVRDLSQLIGLFEETFGSLPSFLSDDVSLGSKFRHEE